MSRTDSISAAVSEDRGIGFRDGPEEIPGRWRETLCERERIESLASQLAAR
jgi:hypothetical protein